MVSEVGRSSESKINTANSLQPKTKTRRMHNKTEAEEEAQTVLAHLPTTEAEEEAQTVLAPLPTTEEEEEETPMIRTTVPRLPVAPQVSFRPRNQSE